MVDKTTVPVPQSFLLDALPEAKAAVWSTDESASKCDCSTLPLSSSQPQLIEAVTWIQCPLPAQRASVLACA